MKFDEVVDFASAPFKIIDGDRGKNYPKQDEFADMGYCLFLSATNVTSQGFDFSQCQYISEQRDNALGKGKLQREDVVLTTRGTIGNSAFYHSAISLEHIRINSGMVIFRCDPTKLLPTFLYYFLRSPQFHAQVNALRSGVAQPQLPIRDMRHIKMPFPELRLQQAVTDVLSAYDDLIENNRRRIGLLEQAARLLYQEWFVHLRFPGHEHVPVVGGVPAGWARKKIADVCETVGGGTPSTGVADYWDGDVTWVVPTDVTRNDCLTLLDSERKITDKGLRESSAKMLPAQSILMTSRASVGFFALVDQPVSTNQGFINIIPHQNEHRMYLLFNLMSRVEEIRGNAKGSTYPEISKGRFREMDVIIPSETLVNEFGRVASDIVQQVWCLKKAILQLTKARDLLLPRLMNGEIAV